MKSPEWLKTFCTGLRLFVRSVVPDRNVWINFLESSLILETGARVLGVVKPAAVDSGWADASTLFFQSVQSSVVYCWVTRGPEATVAVIDLREARLLNPMLVFIGIAAEHTKQFLGHSFIYETATRISTPSNQRPLYAVSTVIVTASASFVVVSWLFESLILIELLFAAGMACIGLFGYRVGEYV